LVDDRKELGERLASLHQTEPVLVLPRNEVFVLRPVAVVV
jgi:hypothetical protein